MTFTAPETRPPRPPLSARRARATVLGILGLLALAGLAGCGSSAPGGTGRTVDASRLEAQISTGLATRLQIVAPRVTCPTGTAKVKGTTFACSTTVDGQALAINAEVATGDNVGWQPASAVISTARTAVAINEKLGAQLQLPVVARCGSRMLTVVTVGTSFTCSASVNGAARQVAVKAEDLAGNVSLTLVPPTTGPGSTTPPVTAAPTPGSTPQTPATLPGD